MTLQRNSLNTLCNSNQLFFDGFQLASLLLNMCLCIDLILTIYSPFTPAGSRLKWYYLITVAASIFLVFTIYGS